MFINTFKSQHYNLFMAWKLFIGKNNLYFRYFQILYFASPNVIIRVINECDKRFRFNNNNLSGDLWTC